MFPRSLTRQPPGLRQEAVAHVFAAASPSLAPVSRWETCAPAWAVKPPSGSRSDRRCQVQTSAKHPAFGGPPNAGLCFECAPVHVTWFHVKLEWAVAQRRPCCKPPLSQGTCGMRLPKPATIGREVPRQAASHLPSAAWTGPAATQGPIGEPSGRPLSLRPTSPPSAGPVRAANRPTVHSACNATDVKM